MAYSSGTAIVDLYKGVISDVVTQMKEAFMDDLVDLDVLNHLKKEWEDKVTASGCVDLDGTGRMVGKMQQKQPNPRNYMPQQQQQQQQQQQMHYSIPSGQRIPLVQRFQSIPGSSLSQSALTAQSVLPTGTIAFAPRPVNSSSTTTVRMVQPPYTMMHGPNNPGFMVVNAPLGRQISAGVVTMPSNIVSPSTSTVGRTENSSVKAEPLVSQLDGLAGVVKKKSGKLPQLDGPGELSGSSSDEEIDEDEDDDPLKRIVDRIGEGTNDDEEQEIEDDPLNSEDDQSDDEDIDTLFDADNVVMCQFEKVHRARCRWKFNLKDGIMHILGKDHVFQRATGEAEW